MPFGAHETMEAHEMLNEKVNLINHFSMYAEQCEDQRLRQMLQAHLNTAIRHYDQLVAYTHDYSAAQGGPQAYGMPPSSPQQIKYGLHQPIPQIPQMHGRLNDKQILFAMLSFHKQSAKSHMAASLECADPNLRQMLMDGAVTCSNQAYEVFLFMNEQGQYQVPTMNDHTAKTFLHSYKPMEMGGYAGNPAGSSISGAYGSYPASNRPGMTHSSPYASSSQTGTTYSGPVMSGYGASHNSGAGSLAMTSASSPARLSSGSASGQGYSSLASGTSGAGTSMTSGAANSGSSAVTSSSSTGAGSAPSSSSAAGASMAGGGMSSAAQHNGSGISSVSAASSSETEDSAGHQF